MVNYLLFFLRIEITKKVVIANNDKPAITIAIILLSLPFDTPVFGVSFFASCL